MKKIYSYLISIPIVLLSLIPAIKWYISLPRDTLWFWYVLIAGFLGVYTIFLEINIFLKIIAIGSFINCFFSSAPYFSFSAYISLIACCYFYILCSKIKDWKTIFKVLQVILLMNIFLIFMQAIGQDSLLSFGIARPKLLGIIGQNMQMGSLSVILGAMLISFSPLNFVLPFLIGIFCNSQGSLLCVAVGFLLYAWTKNKKVAVAIFLAILILFSVLINTQGKIIANLSHEGRIGVWKKTIELSNQRPLAGWGIGTYRHIFHPLGQIDSQEWKTAHNDFLQVLFETGYPGLIVMVGFFGWLFYSLFRTKEYLCLSGLAMIVVDMQVHFPMRSIRILPIIILFLAYCGQKVRKVSCET